MKGFGYVLGLLLLSICSCKSGNKQNMTTNEEADSEQGFELTIDPEELVVRTMTERFQAVDEDLLKEQEEFHLMILKDSSEEEKDEYIKWFYANVAHIDSIGTQVTELMKQKKYAELVNLMEKEMGNFQSHPSCDTYVAYDINCIMAFLYQKTIPDQTQLYKKLIPLWEMNLVRIRAVQYNWEEFHPLYETVLNDLWIYYNQVGDSVNRNKIHEELDYINGLKHAMYNFEE